MRREESQIGPPAPSGKMLPVGRVGFARIGGTGDFNITPGAISEACKMDGRLVLNGERGEGAFARHLQRGNIIAI